MNVRWICPTSCRQKKSRDLVNFNSDFSFRILSKKGDDDIHGIARKILFLTGWCIKFLRKHFFKSGLRNCEQHYSWYQPCELNSPSMLVTSAKSLFQVRLSFNIGISFNSGAGSCEAAEPRRMRTLFGLNFGVTTFFIVWKRQKQIEKLSSSPAAGASKVNEIMKRMWSKATRLNLGMQPKGCLFTLGWRTTLCRMSWSIWAEIVIGAE